MSDDFGKGSPFSSKKRSLACLSGWGVAVAVGLVAAPAIQDYWFSEEGACMPSSGGVTLAIPPKPVVLAAGTKPGAAPVALAGMAPVAQPVEDLVQREVPGTPPDSARRVDAAQTADSVQRMTSAESIPSSPPADRVDHPSETPSPSGEAPVPHAVEVPTAPTVPPVGESVQSAGSTQPVEETSSPESPEAAVGLVYIRSEPKGADVIVDGTFLGITPLRFKEALGDHALIIRKQGYESVTRPLDVLADKPTNLNQILQSRAGHPARSTSATAGRGEEGTSSATVGTEAAARKEATTSEPENFKYAIQVGSFSERQGAFKLAAELRRQGFDAYVYESWGKKDPSRLWKSVRIGRFQDLDTARAILKRYKQQGSSSGAYVALNDAAAQMHEVPSGDQRQSPEKEAPPPPPPPPSVEPPKAGNTPQVAAAPARPSRSSPVSSVQDAGVSHRSQVVQEPRVSRREPVAEAFIAAPDGEKEAAEHLFQQSLVFRNNRNVDQEERLLRQVLQKDPGHGLAQRRLSRVLVESGRIAEGLNVLTGAIRGRSAGVLVGEDPNLAAFLAALYQQQNEHGKAIELYRALLQRFPDKGIWRMGMAISMEKEGRVQQALEAYTKALDSSGLSGKLRNFVQKRIQRLK